MKNVHGSHSSHRENIQCAMCMPTIRSYIECKLIGLNASIADRSSSMCYWLMKNRLKSKIFNMVVFLLSLLPDLRLNSTNFIWCVATAHNSIDILHFFFFNSLKSNLWWWIKANSNKIDGIFLFLLYRHSDVQNWCFCFYFLGLQSFHRFHLSDEGHAGRESETWKRVKSNVLFLYSTSPNIIHLCPFYTGFHHLYFSWWHKEYCNKLDGIRCNGFIQSFFYEFFFCVKKFNINFLRSVYTLLSICLNPFLCWWTWTDEQRTHEK